MNANVHYILYERFCRTRVIIKLNAFLGGGEEIMEKKKNWRTLWYTAAVLIICSFIDRTRVIRGVWTLIKVEWLRAIYRNYKINDVEWTVPPPNRFPSRKTCVCICTYSYCSGYTRNIFRFDLGRDSIKPSETIVGNKRPNNGIILL